ncbi:MAG: EAL domain-containing protein [Rhodocyclales bacterium]|nr:EAL domain-containing protein [Rhodocyclales bacterium]
MTQPMKTAGEVDILVVEDSPTQAEQLCHLLQANGYSARAAANGRLGLEEIQRRKPTLVISDIVMPEMDGYALCAAIKGDPELRDIPVVMVTSLAGIQDIARSLECGADNFIRKPYDPKALLARVEYVLLNRELRKNSKLQLGMEVYMGGRKHFISSEREQIVDLLISTYEEAVQMNAELQARQQEIAASNRMLRALYRIAADMNSVTTEAEVCELALRGVLELPDFRAGWIFLDDGAGGLRVAATCELPAILAAPGCLDGGCRCQHMLRSGELRRGAAVVDCERLQKQGGNSVGLHAHVSVPLTIGIQTLGVMNVAGDAELAFSADDLRLLEAVGSQLAIAIQRAQLYQHLEELVGQRTAALQKEVIERTRAEQKVASLNRIYAVLSGINTTIVRVRDRDMLFQETCRIAVALGRFRLAWIGLVDAADGCVRPTAWMSERQADSAGDIVLSAADCADLRRGPFAQAVHEQTSVTCNDLGTAKDVFPAEAYAHGCRALAVFPLLQDGSTVATLALYAAERDAFDAQELALLMELAGDVSFALDYLRKAEQVNYLAYYDVLTRLPNRALIHDRLDQILQARRHEGEERGTVALLLLNVERFKSINDTFGRRVGDILLKLVAQRLGESLGGTDHLARIGNDHFAAILVDVNDTEIARQIDEGLLSSLGRVFEIEGNTLHATFKLGVALYPSDGDNAETLFANAETALRKAGASQERYLFYAPAMNARVSELLTLQNKLHRALENGEFVLYYQPKVDLRNGTVIGLEALIRWRDPDNGLVAPSEFIPLLEETGMILDVGRWVLRQAVADHAAWHAQGLQPQRVAVNVSAAQLRRKDFLVTVEQALARHPEGGNFLDLELTESILMEDIDASVRLLHEMRERGVKIAVDDFGTGYSSLSYLKRFPIDYLKIDASFVRDIVSSPDAAAICVAVVGLAHNLRLEVIAEGVETDGQMNYLRRHQCDQIQGYLFSQPLPADQLAQLLRESRTLSLPTAATDERKSLLIVDDEASILSALKRVLRRDGYEIFVVGSAAEGFDVLAEHEIQVILSDQRMPEMSGTEFLSRVKDLYPDTIRIVLSGYTDLEAITGAINRGAIYRFLTKPWDDEQLREHLREAFRHYAAGKRRK